MSTDSDLHPDFGPSYGDGPNYGIPITVVGGRTAKVRVRFDYAGERPGALPARPGHPDRGRPRLRRRQARDRRRQVRCRLYETWDTRGRTAAGGRLRRGLVAESNALRPDGWTSADAAGLPILPGLLRWNEVKATGSTTPSGSPPT